MSFSLCLNAGSLPAAPLPGSAPAPGGLLFALFGLPLLGALVPCWLGERDGRRTATAALYGTAALAAYLAVVLAPFGGRGAAELVQPLWRVLAINRLQLTVGLCLDAAAAALLGGAALLCGWAARREPRPRAMWLCAACFATALGLLADNLVLRLAGWELLLGAGFLLGRRRLPAALWLGRAGDAALLLGTVLLFWALGGSWSSSRLNAHYQLDFSPPRPMQAQGLESPAQPELGPSLDLGQLRAQLRVHKNQDGQNGSAAAVPAARAALANKLWPGGRILDWLLALFAAAALLKASAGALALLTERGLAWAVRVFLGAAPAFLAAHLLWRLW